jgi:uncharacterized iron-regulated membrane protein
MATSVADIQDGAAASPSRARLWWLVHHWVGLKLTLFLSFTLLTGTLAVVSAEIDWLLLPALRVSPAAAPLEPNWSAIARAAAEHPVTARIRGIDAPAASAFAATVTIERKDGYLGFLYAHPATGQIQGEGSWVNAARILRNMHRHVNLPTRIGVPIVCALALFMVVSIGTSFVVYKKWWRGFFRPVRHESPRRFWGDLHRLAGLWSLWFAVLIALTGIWYLVESLGLDAPLPRGTVAAHELDTRTLAARFGASLAAARNAFPPLRIEHVDFPVSGSYAFRFQGQDRAVLVRPRANTVTVDPATSQVSAVLHAETLNAHQRISEMADPLHFGYFGGYWTKIPWFLLGLTPGVLAVSGFWLWARRRGGAGRTVALGFPSRARTVALATSGLTLAGAYALAAQAHGGWAPTNRLLEHALAKPLALALVAFPLTGLLGWLALRHSSCSRRFTAVCVLGGVWYLGLVTLFQ